MLDLADNQNTKLLFMANTEQEDLADYVRRVRGERSLQAIETRSRRGGSGISRGYVSQIENRYIVSVTTAKLQALARGLGIPEDELFAKARGSIQDDRDVLNGRLKNMSHKFNGLPKTKRPQAEMLIDILERELDRLNEQ